MKTVCAQWHSTSLEGDQTSGSHFSGDLVGDRYSIPPSVCTASSCPGCAGAGTAHIGPQRSANWVSVSDTLHCCVVLEAVLPPRAHTGAPMKAARHPNSRLRSARGSPLTCCALSISIWRAFGGTILLSSSRECDPTCEMIEIGKTKQRMDNRSRKLCRDLRMWSSCSSSAVSTHI